ncbi:hypothetical protein M758_8G153800 [Ceratodon purpureus]|nr:hypothetical protein M758_8G153800 [Ceratodon purpureus]
MSLDHESTKASAPNLLFRRTGLIQHCSGNDKTCVAIAVEHAHPVEGQTRTLNPTTPKFKQIIPLPHQIKPRKNDIKLQQLSPKFSTLKYTSKISTPTNSRL